MPFGPWADRWATAVADLHGLADLVRAEGEVIGHVTTGEYGSQMLSLGGVEHLPLAPHGEVLEWLAARTRPFRGIGWVDAHLVYSALVHRRRLLTLDDRLDRFYREIAGA